MVSIVISAVSLLVSVTVGWLTLFRRGTLHMTQPVLVGFLHEGREPKVFFRSMLYATGKRGYIIEGLYLKIRRSESTQTFNFWMYGQTSALMIGSGLRVGEDGVSFNHHFLPPKDASFAFVAGEYIIDVYASVVNQDDATMLTTIKLTLTDELATTLLDPALGVLFTWGRESKSYHGDVSVPPVTGGRARSVSGAASGKLPGSGDLA